MVRHALFALALLIGCPRPSPVVAVPAPPAVTEDGVRIHFEVFGEGPPLLVINGGFGQDSSGYDTLARLLADTHQVVLYDRRGTGRSPVPVVEDDRHTPWVVQRKQHQEDEVGRLVTEDMRRIAFDCRPALAAFTRPVLVLHGDTDIFPLHISEATRDALSGARLVVLPETGHYGWVEHPEVYRDHVQRFLLGR